MRKIVGSLVAFVCFLPVFLWAGETKARSLRGTKFGEIACRRGGCNGEICASGPARVGICLHRPEFACYAKARCERQADGRCGWTPSAALTRCLAEKRGQGEGRQEKKEKTREGDSK